MAWEKEELEEILQKDFIDNPEAFEAGRRNDDMVDSMLICQALEKEWTEMYAKHADNYSQHAGTYFARYLEDHYERVKNWIEYGNPSYYELGDVDVMDYAINY